MKNTASGAMSMESLHIVAMDDLINFCAEHMSNENWTSEQVRVYMKEMLSQLNYWKQSNK